MAENRDAEVDPRFDPVFQRGYDPNVHGGRRPRSAPRHGTEPVPIQPSGDVPSVRVDATQRAAPESVAAAAREAESSDEFAFRARNPFRIALLVASIVSIGAAALMIWYQIGEDAFYGGFSGTNHALLFRSQLIAALPVPMLTGGLVGVILWLALGALAHRGNVDD